MRAGVFDFTLVASDKRQPLRELLEDVPPLAEPKRSLPPEARLQAQQKQKGDQAIFCRAP